MKTGMRVLWPFVAVLLVAVPARSQSPLEEPRRSQTGWYAGFGAFAALASGAGGQAMVRGGAVVNEYLLLGAEAGILGYSDQDYEHLYADAMATWYPITGQGAFLKGGIGYGSTKEDLPDGSSGERQNGVEARLGVGWEFKPLKRIAGKALCLGIELETASHSAARDADFMILLTLGIY